MTTNMATENGPRWDLTTVLVVVVAIAILLALTFELWVPHGAPLHR